MQEAIFRLESMVHHLEKQLHANDCKLDDFEQYGRINCSIRHRCLNLSSPQASYTEFERFVVNKLNSKFKIQIKSLDSDTVLITFFLLGIAAQNRLSSNL